jgi:hypothetical protein
MPVTLRERALRIMRSGRTNILEIAAMIGVEPQEIADALAAPVDETPISSGGATAGVTGVTAGGSTGGGSTGGTGGGGSTGGGTGTGGGGASSGEVGLVIPISGVATYTLADLPDGDEFEITLDGVLQSDNPPAPPGAVSWAHDQAHGGYYMLVNGKNDGALAAAVVPSFFNAVNVPQDEWMNWVAAHPGVGWFITDHPQGAGHLGSYHICHWNGVFGGAPSGWGNANLADFNAELTNFGFPGWPDDKTPVRADTERAVNVTLRPNGVSLNTDSVVSGSDDANITDKGLVMARGVTGHGWRVLGKSTLVTREGAKRALAGQSLAVLGDKRKTHVVGGTWDDDSTAVDSLVFDFDGAAFNGTVSIVPKTVVTA